MASRDIIQSTVDEFGKESGGTKKSGSWYWRSPESVFVLNLQKSQYSRTYYVNAAIWLLAAGPADAPKPSHCHIQTRLELLMPTPKAERLTRLLNLDALEGDNTRRRELLDLLRGSLLPVLEAATSVEGLRTGEGQRFVEASLVDGDGQRVLAGRK